MNQPKISIIMPAYGVEKYIQACIQSVLSQTFTDFELIVVDDCSPDNSAIIAKKYAEIDARVKVIKTPENRGLAGARNYGLIEACGKYLFFVDSDDSIAQNALEKLVSVAESHNAQVAICGLYNVYCNESGEEIERIAECPPNHVYNNADEIHRQVAALDILTVGRFAWNKLYSREFIQKYAILFEKKEPIEDFMFNLNVYDNASCMVTINEPLYYYMRRISVKTLTSNFNNKLLDLINERYSTVVRLHEKWGINDSTIKKMNNQVHFLHIFVLIQKIYSEGNLSNREKKNYILKIFNDPSIISFIHNIKRPLPRRLTILKFIIQTKSVWIIMFMAGALNQLKKNAPGLYNRTRLKKTQHG